MFAMYTTIFVMILTLISCATVDININPIYQGMIQQRQNGERLIDMIIVEEVCSGYCNHSISDFFTRYDRHYNGNMGAKYPVPESKGSERHRDEKVIDQMLAKAKSLYPVDTVEIKNASANFNSFTKRDIGGNVLEYTRVVYSAEVVTTEPMPEPVTHSANISISQNQGGSLLSVDGAVIGQVSLASISRADLYRRAHNYLTDTNHRMSNANAEFQTVQFIQTDIDLGRIRGIYTFQLELGQKYRITSTFTIDVHDSGSQIQFADTNLQRWSGVGNIKTIGRPEPVFLQSIANLAQAEIFRFTNDLVTSITN